MPSVHVAPTSTLLIPNIGDATTRFSPSRSAFCCCHHTLLCLLLGRHAPSLSLRRRGVSSALPHDSSCLPPWSPLPMVPISIACLVCMYPLARQQPCGSGLKDRFVPSTVHGMLLLRRCCSLLMDTPTRVSLPPTWPFVVATTRYSVCCLGGTLLISARGGIGLLLISPMFVHACRDRAWSPCFPCRWLAWCVYTPLGRQQPYGPASLALWRGRKGWFCA